MNQCVPPTNSSVQNVQNRDKKRRFKERPGRHFVRSNELGFDHLEDRRVLDGAMAGMLDQSFGVDGFALAQVDLGSDWTYGAGRVVVVQDDGKILAGGFARKTHSHDYQGVIARLNSDGTLDETFADAGIYMDELFSGSFGPLHDLAVDHQGRILWSGGKGFVSRLNPDGSLDTSFGLPDSPGRFWGSDRLAHQSKLLPQSDGSIVVAAQAHNYFIDPVTSVKSVNDIAIFKLTANGMPDPAFGVNLPNDPSGAFIATGAGITGVNFGVSGVEFDLNEQMEAVVQTTDNKFIVVGNTFGASTAPTGIAVRFNADGSLDTTFGTDGRLFITDQWHGAWEVKMDSADGYLIASSMGIRRFDSTWNLDSSFGDSNGSSQIWHGVRSLAIQPDGKIIAAGGETWTGAISRLNPDGTTDPTFNANDTPGYMLLDYPGSGHDMVSSVAFQADGKILAIGRHFNPAGDPALEYVFGIARVHGDLRSVTLSGRVYHDANNNGSFDGGAEETGLEGVNIYLMGTDAFGVSVNHSSLTNTDGTYSFNGILPGTYSLTSDQTTGFLDGKEASGTLGGTVNNSSESKTISGIVIGNDGIAATDYLFGNLSPSELSGLVWEDFNADGQVNFGEKAIGNVGIHLSGTDDRGNSVNLDFSTDSFGVYLFYDLRPGDYSLTEVQPAGFNDGIEDLGTVNGLPVGVLAGNDQFANIALSSGAVGINYNFGERPLDGGGVSSGQTATIGFWQNKNGRNLVLALNGGQNSTQLGNWLAATFPNMYGSAAGANNLAEKTNVQVWNFYNSLFRRKQQEAIAQGLAGPNKVDAQIFATALAVYVTNQTLAGSTASSYGFVVTQNGLGTSTFNVGNSGQAFGVADNSAVSVMNLLLAVNARSRNGLLYDLDGDGDANDSLESGFRTMANNIFSEINETGDI